MTCFVVFGLLLAARGESLVYQGLTNSSVGNASLVISNNQLAVSNLGTNGQDGVELEMGSAGNFVLNTFYETPAGDGTMTITSLGYIGGQPGQPVGSITIGFNGLNETHSFDFSPIGASTYTLRIFNGSDLMYESHNNSGAAYTEFKLEPLPMDDTEMGHFDEQGNYHPGTTTSTKPTAIAMFVGGQMVIGDRALAIPENPANVVEALSGERIQASGSISNLNLLAESLTEENLTLSALGNAIFQPAGRKLTVANLGTNGQDGVSFTWPSYLTALDVGWEALDPSDALPVGAYVRSQIVGTANAITNGVLGTLTETKVGTSNYIVSADYSPLGASTYTVQAFYKGALVAQAVHQNGASLAVAANLSVTRDIDPPASGSIDSARGGTRVLVGGLNVICDHLYVTPENVSVSGGATALQIVASKVPSITFNTANETVIYQGFTNSSLGSAILVVSSNQLTVANLGTNGQGGVSFEHVSDGAAKGQASDIEIHIEPPDASGTLPVGAVMQEQALGTTNGVNGVLGTLAVTKAGSSNYVVSADFSPLGASNYIVQAYLQGALVAQVTNQTGTSIAQANKMAFSFDIRILPDPNTYWSLSTDWAGSPANLVLTGGSIATCDQLFVTPENVTFDGPPTALQITASQVPSFTITSVTATPMVVSLSRINQNATLRWYGAGVLQVSFDLKNWSDLSAATSPYTVPMIRTNQFFRVLAPNP